MFHHLMNRFAVFVIDLSTDDHDWVARYGTPCDTSVPPS